jgi:DNA repair protein RadC
MQYVTTLQDLIARGKQRRPELSGRLERAALIALFRRIDHQEDGTYLVESDLHPGQFYRVNGTCECPDHARAPENWCKHRIAIALLQASRDRETRKRIAGNRVALAYAGLLQESPDLAAPSTPRACVRSPEDIYHLVQDDMPAFEQEHMRVLVLDTKNRLMQVFEQYIGTLNACTVRVGELFREAIRHNGASLALVHNHPSGDPTPSPQDIELTRGIVLAGKLLDIDVLDHLVVGTEGWISLKRERLGFPQL